MTALKQYLGDSVYADMDGGMIKLTTENGGGAGNTIYLEPFVLTALNNYHKWAMEEINGRKESHHQG